MKKTTLALIAIMVLLLQTLVFLPSIAGTPNTEQLKTKFNDQLSKQNTVVFEENKGQMKDQHWQPRPDVLYYGKSEGMNYYIRNNGMSYQLSRVESWKEEDDKHLPVLSDDKEKRKVPDQIGTYRVDAEWKNHNSNFTVEKGRALDGYTNYYNVPDGVEPALFVKQYETITLKNLWNGVDVHYYGTNGHLESDYLVGPGADYKQIQIEIKGAELSTDNGGNLIMKTPFGEIHEGKLKVYQNSELLEAKWVITQNGNGWEVGFDIPNYNPSLELRIDPLTRVWGTYYGGIGNDYGNSCSTDGSGNVYLAGSTSSSNNISSGGYQNAYGSSIDAFIVKFNSNGIRQWGTYYGENYEDYGYSCTTDNIGNIYLAGATRSSGISTLGSFQDVLSLFFDAFLVKFNSNGLRQWCTFYGGTGNDFGYSCSTDGSGNVYLAGFTQSTTAIASGGHQNTYGGGAQDAFLVKFNTNGARQWGTYYGGGGDETARRCMTDGGGNVYLVGWTQSTTNIASSGHQNTYTGGNDGFLAKFSSNGVRQWGTYYGGSGDDYVYSCASDVSDNIYLVGTTNSTTNIASGGHQNAYAGGNADAFLVKFNTNGARQWGSYYGGSGTDQGIYCIIDLNGSVNFVGFTESISGISTSGHQNNFGGGFWDAFIVKINSNGARQWGSYYGGSGNDLGYSCAADANANIYMAGETSSITNIAIGGSQNFHSDSSDAFLVKFLFCDSSNSPNPILTPTATSVCPGSSASLTVSGGVSYNWNTGSTSTSIVVSPTFTSTYSVTVTGTNGCNASASQTVTLNSNPIITISPISPSVCLGQNINLIAGGASSYSWSNGINNGSITTSPTIATTYSVTGTDVNGCTATASRIVNLYPNPTITISPTSPITCSGQNISLTATGAISYSWSNGITADTTIVAPISASTYSVTGTDANGCSASATKNVNIYGNPNAYILADGIITSSDTISLGDAVQLQLNGSLNTVPNIQWSPNTAMNNSSIQNPIVYPSTTTTYTVTFTNFNGCQQSQTIEIYVRPRTVSGNLSLSSSVSNIGMFDTIVVNVQLNNANNLYGLFMKLKGNVAVNFLNYAGYEVGTLMGSGGSILATPPTFTNGVCDFGISKVGAVPGYSGGGLFYKLKYVTKSGFIPDGTEFCFYIDDLVANDASGTQVGLINQGPICYTFTDQVFVWPGDLNNSKTVTTADILPIGYFYNSTGPLRNNASIQWTGQSAALWGYDKSANNGSAYKVFADANGDGIISNADQTAIGFNISKTHPFGIKKDNHERSGFDGALLLSISPSSINPTQLPQSHNLKVELKDDNGTLNSFYGISFQIHIDSSVFDASSVTFDYTGSIFGTNSGNDFLKIEYTNPSTISVGMTRYANAAINGNGVLCNIQIKTQQTLPNSITSTTIRTLVDESNNELGNLYNISDSAYIIPITLNNGIYELSEQQIKLYPNPVSKTLHIETNERINEVMLFDALGHLVFTVSQPKNNNIDVSRLSSGVYIAEIKTENGIAKRRWVKE
jgi:hypothetical protein